MHTRILVVCLIVLVFGGIILPAEESWEETKLINRLKDAAVPDNEIDLAHGALAIAQSVYPEIDIDSYLSQIDQFAQEIKVCLPAGSTPQKIIQAINKFLYQTKNIESEPMSAQVEGKYDSFLLPKVLDSTKGNCLGLSTFYWSLAERLDLSLQAVIIPRHVFLRHRNQNIEATDRGLNLSEEDYLKKTEELRVSTSPKYSIGSEVGFRSLNKKQFLGLIIYNRGVTYSKSQEKDLAFRDFTNALLLDPDNVEAYKSRGAFYLGINEFTQALADLQMAQRLESDCPATYYNLSTAYFNLNQFKEALEYIDKTIELAPDYAEAYHNRGVIYSRKKDYHRALSDFNQSIKLNQEYAPSYFNRGLVWFNLYNEQEEDDLLEKAIEDYSQAIGLNPKYTEAYNNRGIAYCRQREFEYAINGFLDVISLNSTYAEAYRNLGMAYFELARYESAIKYLKQYLEQISSESPQVKDVKKVIKEAQRRIEQR